jgi:hypothetical protein
LYRAADHKKLTTHAQRAYARAAIASAEASKEGLSDSDRETVESCIKKLKSMLAAPLPDDDSGGGAADAPEKNDDDDGQGEDGDGDKKKNKDDDRKYAGVDARAQASTPRGMRQVMGLERPAPRALTELDPADARRELKRREAAEATARDAQIASLRR